MVQLNVMHTKRTRGIIALACAAAVVVLAVFLLINANRLIKERLEAALGENFSLDRISVGLGGVDAYGLQVRKDGQTVIRADKLTLRASLLGLIRKRYVISSIAVENPAVTLTIDKQGRLVNPFLFGPSSSGAATRNTAASPAALPGLEIRRIRITGGLLRLTDERLPAPYGFLELHNRLITFDSFSYPFADKTSAVSLAASLKGGLIAGELQCKGSVNLKTAAVDLSTAVHRLELFAVEGKGPAVTAEAVRFTIASAREKPTRYVIPAITIARPSARIETGRNGELLNPLAKLAPNGNGRNTKKDNGAAGRSSLLIKKITMSDGELLYLDSKASQPPHRIRLTGIAWQIDHLALPFDNTWTTYSFSARIPGAANAAALTWEGKTLCRTLDTDARIALRGLDIRDFKPYYHKKGDAEVTRGTLAMTIDLGVRNKIIDAPGRAVIRDLEFAPARGLGGKFLGAPRSLVIKLLQSGNNEISLDFVVEGDLGDPQFNLSESLVKRMTVGLAKGLGLTVVDAGRSVVELGAKGVGQVGKGIIGIGKGVQGLFKRDKR